MSLVPAGRKSLDDRRNGIVREMVRAHIEKAFDGNQSKAAKAYGIQQATLNDFMNGKRGAGVTLLAGFATCARVSTDVLLGLAPASDDPLPNKTRVMGCVEFKDAAPRVRAAFASIEAPEDMSCVGWAWELMRLVEWESRGWLERERPKLMLVEKNPDDAKDRESPSDVPKV